MPNWFLVSKSIFEIWIKIFQSKSKEDCLESDKLILKNCVEEQMFKNNLIKITLNVMLSEEVTKNDSTGLQLNTWKAEFCIYGKIIF